MRGIVFREFLELVEEKFGLEMADNIITSSELNSNGVCTSLGTYSFSEMLQLLTHLSTNTGLSIGNLLLVYADHFFGVIKKSYPNILSIYKDPIEMISSIEKLIHIKVRKIDPESELPIFEVIEKTDNSLTMKYNSSRSMHFFGLGLMNKTFEHFNATATIEIEKIKADGTEVRFVIYKN
tara:strand:- start:6283 stop:6822 length:540 start_codon:yes stop_codon:yes gene_type:complete